MVKQAGKSKHERKNTRPKTRTKKTDDSTTAFPAPLQTPGQAESRKAYERFTAKSAVCPWWDDYMRLRDEGYTWRVAVYIAWASSPARDRWPATQQELAEQFLGLRSDRTIRKWRGLNPKIDERVITAQAEPLLRHRRDVFEALVEMAALRDPGAHGDRKLFLQMTGDYRPREAIELSGRDGEPIETMELGYLAQLSEEEIDQLIVNLEEIQGAVGRGTAGKAPATSPAGGGARPADVDGAAPKKAATRRAA